MTATPRPARCVLALRLECACGAMRVRHAPPAVDTGWAARIIAQASADGWTAAPHQQPVRCPACTRSAHEKKTS